MSIATYGELQTAVDSAVARPDVPSYVYALTTAELNARLRLREMETETTLSTGGNAYVTLPSDFVMVRHAYLDVTPRQPLDAMNEFERSRQHDSSGRPNAYTISGGLMYLNPAPDTTYTVTLRYLARLAAFSADADTNDVLVNFPALYLYSALKHVAIWAQDREQAEVYAAAFMAEAERVEKQDIAARHGGGPLRSRAGYTP